MLQSIFYLCVHIPLVDILILYKPTHHPSIQRSMLSFISCEKHELKANVAIRWGIRSQGKTKRRASEGTMFVFEANVMLFGSNGAIDGV